MRLRRRIVATAAAVVAATLGSGGALAATGDAGITGPAEVRVDGVIERLADVPAHVGTAIRLPGGERLRIDDPAGAGPGDRVSATFNVTSDVAAAAAADRPVAGIDGEVTPTRSALAQATRIPADPTSELAEATVADVLAADDVVDVEDVRVLGRAQPAATPTGGVHEIYVAIVVPKGVRAAPVTRAQVTAQVAGASSYWRDVSGGVRSLRVARVSEAYTSSYGCSDSAFAMWTEAARAVGFTEGPRRHLLVAFPRAAVQAGCSYGLASMGKGLDSGGVVYVSDTSWPVFAHEIGHNFGLAHAKTLRCANRADTPLSAPAAGCRLEDYGDPYDVMAASPRENVGVLSAPQAHRIGLLPTTAVREVSGASTTTRLTLAPVSGLRGVRAARIRDPRNGEIYWVEYRTRTGRDARLYQQMSSGVRVLREEPVTSSQPWSSSVALDATPTGSARDWSWHVPDGHRLTAFSGSIHVQVERADAAGATVSITLSTPTRPLVGARAGLLTRVGRAMPVTAAPTMRSVTVNSRGTVGWAGRNAVRYDVVYRPLTGSTPGRVRTWYAGTTLTSATWKGARGTRIQVAVRARSADGRVSPYSTWRTVTVR